MKQQIFVHAWNQVEGFTQPCQDWPGFNYSFHCSGIGVVYVDCHEAPPGGILRMEEFIILQFITEVAPRIAALDRMSLTKP